MRSVHYGVIFYLLRYIHTTVLPLRISVTRSYQYCSPRDKGLCVSFFQVFIKFRLDANLTFLYFPIYFLESMNSKLPACKKLLFEKQYSFQEINVSKELNMRGIASLSLKLEVTDNQFN